MKTRTTIITIAALAVLALAATSYAGPGHGRGGYGCPGWGDNSGNGMGYGMRGQGPGNGQRGMGPGMMYGQGNGMGPGGAAQQLSPEQSEKLQALSLEYGDKAEALNKKLFAKNAELDAAYAAEKIDIGKVKSLAGQIGDLRGELFRLRAEYRAKLIAEDIINPWHGRRGQGFGPGSCLGVAQGYGPGPDAPQADTP